mgnify:FL=1
MANKTSSSFGGFPLERDNFVWLGAGLVTLLVGYLLMAGGGSDDPEVFSEAIFSFRRITLAPVVVLTGYSLIFYAILKRK